MKGDKLTLEFDEADQVVWLIVTSHSGIQRKELVWLRESFGVDDVREAIMATGWVCQNGSEIRLVSDSDCQEIREVVDKMLGYFSTPGVPGTELLEIQSAVADYIAEESGLDIPLYAYALLDVMVREDIADEARSASGLWNHAQVVVESQRYCDRRVEELLSRYSQPSHGTYRRMARSSPTRHPNYSRGAKTG